MQDANTNFVYLGIIVFVMLILFAVICSTVYGNKYEQSPTPVKPAPSTNTAVRVLTKEEIEQGEVKEFERVLATVRLRSAQEIFEEVKRLLVTSKPGSATLVGVYDHDEPRGVMRKGDCVASVYDVLVTYTAKQYNIKQRQSYIPGVYPDLETTILANDLNALLKEYWQANYAQHKSHPSKDDFLDKLFVKYKTPTSCTDASLHTALPIGVSDGAVLLHRVPDPWDYPGRSRNPFRHMYRETTRDDSWPYANRLEFFLGHFRIAKKEVSRLSKHFNFVLLPGIMFEEFPSGKFFHKYTASEFVKADVLTVECLNAIRHMGKDHRKHRKMYRSAGFLNIELRKGDDIILISDRPAYFAHNVDFKDVLDNSLVSGIAAAITLADNEIGMKEFPIGNQRVKWFYNTTRIEA